MMKLSVLSVVDGDIAVENKTGGLQVVSGLQADGDEVDAAGDITLKSDGNMQTDGTIKAANDVTLTSTNGAMTIGSRCICDQWRYYAAIQGRYADSGYGNAYGWR